MDSFLQAMGRFVSKGWMFVLALALVLLVAAVFGARKVNMATGASTIISPQSQVYKDYEKYGENFGSDPIAVLITAGAPGQLVQNLPAMDHLEADLNSKANVLSAVGPAFALKQALQIGGRPSSADWERAGAALLDPASGQLRPQFARVFPQGKYAIIRVTPKGNLERSAQKSVINDVKVATEQANFAGDVTATVTGVPAVGEKMQDMMRTSMRNMILLAAVLMLAVLALIFTVRGSFARRWLSLGVVLVGIIYTFGVMGMLGVPMTMVSMAVFPILIGLGVDYGVQFHSRYDEAIRSGRTPAEAVALSLRRMAPAVGLALLATALGFVALFVSPVTMIRDFGRMLLIGIVVCYAAAALVLLSLLYWRDRRTARIAAIQDSANTGANFSHTLPERILRRLAGAVIHRPLVIILPALALTAAGFVADRQVTTETDELKFVSQEAPAIKELMSLQNLAGGIMTANVMVEAPDVADPSVVQWMIGIERNALATQKDTVAGVRGLPDLLLEANSGKVPDSSLQAAAILDWLPAPAKANMVNRDYTLTSITFTLKDVDTDHLQKFRADMTSMLGEHPDGVTAALTGRAVTTLEMFHALSSGRMEMTLLGAALILGGLLLAFRRNWLRAVLAVVPIGLIVGWSGGMMYLLGMKYTPLTATLGALIIGIGSEFIILLMMRYYEERGKNEPPFEAMSTAMVRVGRAILASGVAVMAGFGAMLISGQFPILRDFGIVTMIDVGFALVSTLVVLPPLIVWIDSRRKVVREGEASAGPARGS